MYIYIFISIISVNVSLDQVYLYNSQAFCCNWYQMYCICSSFITRWHKHATVPLQTCQSFQHECEGSITLTKKTSFEMTAIGIRCCKALENTENLKSFPVILEVCCSPNQFRFYGFICFSLTSLSFPERAPWPDQTSSLSRLKRNNVLNSL